MSSLGRFLLALFLVFLYALPSSAESVVEKIASGDKLYEEFDNLGALREYELALQADPDNYEALWKISRAYVDIGEHLPEKEQLPKFESALEYAEKAIMSNPEGSMGYLRRAIVNGRIALFKGVWSSVGIVKEVKKDCEMAIKLDPGNDVAYYVLARTHQKVSEKPRAIRFPLGLRWASYGKAVKNYNKAIELDPDFIMYHIDLARCYLEMGEEEKAATHLKLIGNLPVRDEDDLKFKEEAEVLLKKMGKSDKS